MEKFKTFINKTTENHLPIISFFKRNYFGSCLPVLTYLSVLSKLDRCIILENLFNPDALNSNISDKLLLAYVTSGRQDLAEDVIQNSIENGESDENIWGLRSKMDLGIAPQRNKQQRLDIYKNFQLSQSELQEIEFLKILIQFCENEYTDEQV